MKRRKAFFLFLILTVMLFAGCAVGTGRPEKIKDVEYTVLEESEVPEELLEKMKEKKSESYTMSYQSEGYMYIARGYGAQATSGYSIRVMELYESAEGIVFVCELLGPAKNEPVLRIETYPTLVIKLQDTGLELLPETAN